jgi:hypothetical protein
MPLVSLETELQQLQLQYHSVLLTAPPLRLRQVLVPLQLLQLTAPLPLLAALLPLLAALLPLVEVPLLALLAVPLLALLQAVLLLPEPLQVPPLQLQLSLPVLLRPLLPPLQPLQPVAA